MSQASNATLVVNGWAIFAHPLFLNQLELLTLQVEAFRQKDGVGFAKKNATKRLAAIAKLAFEVIPQNPAGVEYRQGSTLGDEHKHWFRAKFFQQYRLFFRYHAQSKIIVFAWVNDENTKRAYESGDDAYRVFRKMLESGHPPDHWDHLHSDPDLHKMLIACLAHSWSNDPLAPVKYRQSAIYLRAIAIKKRLQEQLTSTSGS